MKNILIFSLILFSIFSSNIVFSQISKKAIPYNKEKIENNKLQKIPVLSIDKQFARLREIILQQYGSAFKYSSQIQNGMYEMVLGNNSTNIDRKRAMSTNNYAIAIKDIIHNKPVDKIKLINKYDENNNLIIIFNADDLNRLIDRKILQKPNPLYITDLCNLVVKDSILEDQEIVKDMDIPEAYWTKILNRSFTTSHLKDQFNNDAVLFNHCVAGSVVLLGNNGENSKILALDQGFHSIIYFDANIKYFGNPTVNECYGYQGTDYGQFFNPTGITIGRGYISGNDSIYPVYIADYSNHRIIEVNYVINRSLPNQLGYFDNNSYNVFSSIHNPYDISYCKDYNCAQGDKIWCTQENIYHSHLICLDNQGNQVQDFIGYKEFFSGLIYYFNQAEDIRLAVHDYYCRNMILVDRARNRIVSCHLDTSGLGTQIDTNGNALIQAMDVVDFCSNDTVNSVQIQFTGMNPNEEWPYVWVTSGTYIHSFKLDEVGCVQYLASTNKPKNTDYCFSNLLNTVNTNGYFDLMTVESWNTYYGMRRYKPYCDAYQDSLQSYCLDSTDRTRYMANFTNDCNLKIYAYRLNNALPGGWQQVKIKKLNNSTSYIVNDSIAIKYQVAGQNQTDWGRYVDLQLDLPLQDYVFGGQIQVAVKLYPAYSDPYDPSNYNYNEKFYFTDIKKTCRPKPGGCPYIYVLDTSNTYKVDNNILHRSEFTEFSGQDIMDRYKININPLIDGNGNIQIAIIENENDSSIFDEAKLYYIDHPIGTTVGVTENNDVVYYNQGDVISTDFATLNDSKITPLIQYTTQVGTKGYINDSLYAHYPNTLNTAKVQKNFNSKSDVKDDKSGIKNDNTVLGTEKNNKKSNNANLNSSVPVQNFNKKTNPNTNQKIVGKNKGMNVGGPHGGTDSLAVITLVGNLDTLRPVMTKTWAGNLTVYDYLLDSISTKFARREQSAETIIPVFGLSGGGIPKNVEHLNVNWLSDFKTKYVSVVPIHYNTYSINEIPLQQAFSITANAQSDITGQLTNIDKWYGFMNQNSYINLTFRFNSISPIPPGYTRDYIFEIVGQYIPRGLMDKPMKVTNNQIPLTNKLYYNYPNPFNPTTIIRYDIKKDAFVKMKIYNLLGQEVRTLVNENKKAGSYNVVFDGTNLASGVYFYRINAGDFVETKKMVLVK